MTRKQREAHVRRAMAAGRRGRPMPESGAELPDLLHGESVCQACWMDTLDEGKHERVTKAHEP